MKKVLATTNAANAHIAVAALASAGIEAVISGEYMGGLPAGQNALPSVWVGDDDYELALEVLDLAEAPTVSEGVTSHSGSPLKTALLVVVAVLTFLCFQLL